jgi:hypothetical protein
MAGYTILLVILNGSKRGLAEVLSLSFFIGGGAVSTLFFWGALLGLKPSRWILAAIFTISFSVLLFFRYKHKLLIFYAPEKLRKNELILFILGGIILIALFTIVSIHALAMPLYDIDAYAIWGLKAKILFREGFVKGGPFYSHSLSYSHLSYPLLLPFLTCGVYTSIGYVDDVIGKIIFPLIYIAGTAFIFSSLRWQLGRGASLLFTLLFISMPAVIRWNSSGLADLPLAFFYAASIFYLVKFLKEEQMPDLIIAFFMTLFSAFIKNEGMVIAVINVVVFIIFYPLSAFSLKKLKRLIFFPLLLLLLMAPWFIWSAGIPKTHENYPLRILNFFSMGTLHRLKDIAELFIMNMVQIRKWGFLWFLIPLTLIMSYKISFSKPIMIIWSLMAAHFAAYVFVFVISPWSPQFLASMALERILIHIAPAVIYLAAFYLKDAGKIQCDNSGKSMQSQGRDK